MSRIKELNLKRIAFYALGILLCYAGITYMDTWLTKGNQDLNDSFNTIDWFCETRIRVLKGNYLLVDTKKESILRIGDSTLLCWNYIDGHVVN